MVGILRALGRVLYWACCGMEVLIYVCVLYVIYRWGGEYKCRSEELKESLSKTRGTMLLCGTFIKSSSFLLAQLSRTLAYVPIVFLFPRDPSGITSFR